MCVFIILCGRKRRGFGHALFLFYRNGYIEKSAAPHITARRIGDYLN